MKRCNFLRLGVGFCLLFLAGCNNESMLELRIEALEKNAILHGDKVDISSSKWELLDETENRAWGFPNSTIYKLDSNVFLDVSPNNSVEIEGQLRWIPRTYWKKGYLEFYNGKEWIVIFGGPNNGVVK